MKHMFYDEELDVVNLSEEIADSHWYDSLALDVFRRLGFKITFGKIWRAIIDKLKDRYPEKFTTEKAINRDLAKERATLEGVKDE